MYWAKWWVAMAGFNIREESYIHESILFGFPGSSDDVIAINYCILFTKHYIYLEKLKEKKKKKKFNVDLMWYICCVKYILKIENKFL